MELADNWNDKKLNIITGYHIEQQHGGLKPSKKYWFTLKDIADAKNTIQPEI